MLHNGGMTTPADDGDARELPASQRDGSYPRPQLVRPDWVDLSGQWSFRFDDLDEGLDSGWNSSPGFESTIIVPFPPESPASGIGDAGFHPVSWYHREITASDLDRAGTSTGRTILHFGAVDYRCRVWVDGQFLGCHEGGHTPFSFDVTAVLGTGREVHSLVVRTEDDPLDLTQPRGKQDWELNPHSIWYHRTSGIWQPVWLETVPQVSIEQVHLTPEVRDARVRVDLRLREKPRETAAVSVELSLGDLQLGSVSVPMSTREATFTVPIPALANGQGYEQLLWSPEEPRLVDAIVTLRPGGHTPGTVIDTVRSYLGLRTVEADRGVFLLNDRPYYLRSVLSQGYWPESHLASPSLEALRAEVQLIKDLGFNAVRIHQKIEDPRFLFFADTLGLLAWGEAPSAFEFGPTAVKRAVTEWIETVDRDRSHPSIVTWVPLNESWGVQHIAHDPTMQNHARALFHLTKALDPSRPVVSNDGWEHLDSDIWSIHDYEAAGAVVEERYSDAAARDRLFSGIGPGGRRIRLTDELDRGQPVMLTEFGGIHFASDDPVGEAWGYSSAVSAEDFASRLGGLLDAVRASSFLAGYCYTQLTDTMQEANGLVTEKRVPKLPLGHLRAIMTGQETDR